MNRRRTDLVMVDQGLILRDNVPCESPTTPACTFEASRYVEFANLKINNVLALCSRCEATYLQNGYRWGPKTYPEAPGRSNDSNAPQRLVDDDDNSRREYLRRERQGF